jgi:hypothetical protein
MLALRRFARWLPLGVALALAALAVALGGGAHPSLGQSGSATPATGPEQPITNSDAVRLVLPADIRDNGSVENKLPVYKWSRADMYNTTAGHLVFITTILPYTESDGTQDVRLISNFLSWDGAEWTPQLQNYLGIALTGDSIWLANNLTDISAYSTPADSVFQGFFATYSASGTYSDGVTRDETVAAVYDLTPSEVWTRVTHLQEVDSSNTGWVATHTEDADWAFKNLNGKPGIAVTVTDSDTIDLTGAGDASAAPPTGTTTTTSTETYVLGPGGFVSLTPGAPPSAPSAASPSPAGTPVATPGETPAPVGPSAGPTAPPIQPPTPAPTAVPTLCAAPNIIFPRSMTPIPTCAPAPRGAPQAAPQPSAVPQGTPAG